MVREEEEAEMFRVRGRLDQMNEREFIFRVNVGSVSEKEKVFFFFFFFYILILYFIFLNLKFFYL